MLLAQTSAAYLLLAFISFVKSPIQYENIEYFSSKGVDLCFDAHDNVPIMC